MSVPLQQFIVSAITFALASLPCSCFGTTVLANGHSVKVWQTDDGLPQNMVTSAVQTRDGYLWFGTYSGLARFDGARFEVFDPVNTPELQDRRISCLFEDAQGTLWIGQESGTIDRYRDGRFEPFPVAVENSEKVLGLGSDSRNRVWAMRQSGSLECLETSDRAQSLIAPSLPGVMAWSRSPRGELWVAENGQAARLTDGKLRLVDLPPAQRTNYVLCVAAAADGGAWIFCDNRIRKWSDDRWTEDLGAYPWPDGPIAYCLELKDGTLAIGTIYSGLYLVFRDSRPPVHFDRDNGLPQNWVRFLYEDREGTLWAGVGSAGLVSIHKTALSVLNSPDQWQGCTVLSVASGRKGELWIGTDGGGLYRFAEGQWSHFGAAEGLNNVYIPAVAESADSQVWAGNFWWGGPYRLEDGRFVRPSCLDETATPVFSLYSTSRPGEILVGNCDGLLQIEGDSSRWLVRAPSASAGGVYAIAQDKHGGIWCGFAQAGLVRLADGKTTSFRQNDGLSSDAVQCIVADDDGSIWIGTADKGLSRFKDGRFANLGVEHGLIDSVIGYILDDGCGFFWLSTHHGLQRISKVELNRCADGLIPNVSSQVFGQGDGLPTSEFVGGLQAAATKTPDGRLWFACSKGLICVDPTRIERNPTPPPVVLQSFIVDGAAVPLPTAAADAILPPDHRRLEFRYAGLSFAAPNKVRFKYRLDGIDKAWVDADSKRTAFYSRLPAGEYRFRVTACNNDGVWNTEGAALSFSVEPFLWQTWWFISGCLLAAAAAIAAFARQLTRRRMQRKLERAERKHAIERERTRIAQDIHDDIGASLSRIAMLSQPAHSDLAAESERTTATLSRIYGTARDLTRSLDEIVWAVDPKHDTLDSLVDYMGKYAHDLLSAASVRCRLNLPVSVPTWPLTAEMRHNLFLSFKEALNNALKHSAAEEVRISLTLHTDSFELIVQDNGRGFEPKSTRALPSAGRIASGNGLRNMEKRIAGIGGHCELSSQPGEGTTVVFTVKVPDNTPPPARSPSHL
jgi:signal transduction histidine kinase/ligand-binding sensor domain-containing protein